ncbi:Hypothetical protein SMAX5B_013682 [Scophthalmus maximus]|uniref:Uncharacterized protein n=1 Tax=Scophthalmus maximus TaxID=52904 RepID=A0A2U9AZV2_SCOMX|nr:Hypothetical protein SMAX5B_013682 [Scophthalmus maximus]KAF0022639.1 hypothetical protein F2P81_025031 [Scophthalmus maximus]
MSAPTTGHWNTVRNTTPSHRVISARCIRDHRHRPSAPRAAWTGRGQSREPPVTEPAQCARIVLTTSSRAPRFIVCVHHVTRKPGRISLSDVTSVHRFVSVRFGSVRFPMRPP